ncbi:MAG: B12-binding domain-containing radical SAM protein [Synergistaceae bacterium]|nr:B12-binding domain-containing radical SAM protein [Synergistaceae bacterium]
MYELLIINAYRQYEAERNFNGDWLGIHLLASFIEQNGHSARAFAGYAHEVEAMLEEQMEFGVKVIGFSCDYENQIEVEELSRMVKKRWNVPVVVGGPQAVALGGDFLARSEADVVARGEGELPLLALMHFYVDGTGSLEEIPGITFMNGEKAVRTPDQEPILNLDALPFPDPKLSLNPWFRRDTAAFITARGCPFRCAFCYEGGNTRVVRRRSVENVMEEIRQVLEERPSIRFFLFTDDTFTLDAKRLRHFCEELSSFRKERDFGWFAEAHPAMIVDRPETLPLMLEAGLCSLQIGVESGSPEVLRAYNKGTTPEMLEKAVEICADAGLSQMFGNIIVGGALESEKTAAQSKQFGLSLLEGGAGMLELNAIYFWPLPGTAMTKCPDKFGLEIIDPRSMTSVTDYPVVRSGDLSPERLSGLQAEMGRAFEEKISSLAPRLSEERAMKCFLPLRKYGHWSRWCKELYLIDRIRKFCALRLDGAIRHLRDVPAEELDDWHPQRTCPPRVENGQSFGGDMAIDAELYEALVASSGRQTVLEAAESCELSRDAFLRRAEELERRMMLGFCKY